jgi:hypothetical protein
VSQAGNGKNSLNGRNDSGNGAGHDGGRIPANARRLDRRVIRPNYLPNRINPEQGCYGCLISAGVILATLLFWVFIYWYNEPTFHPPDEDAPTPPPAQTLRRRNQNQ